MYSSLDHYSQSYTIDVSPEWDGAKSQKFKKGKRILPHSNLLKDSNISILSSIAVEMPDQTIFTGRQHFVN
jgi:hypothetical protein